MDNTDEKGLLRSFFLKKEKRPHFHNMDNADYGLRISTVVVSGINVLGLRDR